MGKFGQKAASSFISTDIVGVLRVINSITIKPPMPAVKAIEVKIESLIDASLA